MSQADEPVRLTPARARPADRVAVRAPGVPSTSGAGPCVLTWDGVPAGNCEADGAGAVRGSLAVPETAAGPHELAVCRPTCAAPRGGRASTTVTVALVAGSASPEGTVPASDGQATDPWTWLLLLLAVVAALAVLAGPVRRSRRRLRGGRLLHVEPVPDDHPDVRTVLEVPSPRLPPLRLLVRPDEGPVVLTEVLHDDAR